MTNSKSISLAITLCTRRYANGVTVMFAFSVTSMINFRKRCLKHPRVQISRNPRSLLRVQVMTT
ncbi:hypothetical protein C6Q13_18655 [Burkholderia gladioli]|nr:hypothetical protein C6Q13_18655 [Burkholderia gladioli]